MRIAVIAAPLPAMACHRTGCQRMTRHHYCPRCKAWPFTRPEGMDWFVNPRASVPGAHGWFVPFVEVATAEGLPWARTPARHSSAGQPDPQV